MIPRYPGEVPNPSRGAAAEAANWAAAGGMPSQVRAAARLMYAGAVLGAIGMLYYGFSTSPATTPQIVSVGNPRSAAYSAGFVVGAILFAAIVAGLWLWMAWAIKRGKNWARVVSAILLGLGALRLLEGLVVSPASVVTISWALSWIAGLSGVILLFRHPSSAFFASRGRTAHLPGHPAGYGYAPPHGQAPQAGQLPPHDQAP